MHYRNFSENEISEIGLGTWQLGSADWGVVDENEALTLLQDFVDRGGNFIDTADVYGMGLSEKLIGKFLKKVTSKVFVASKLGRRGDNSNGWPQNFSYERMKQHVEETLEHLGLEQLYLEQLHCIPAEEMKSGEVFEHLRKLKQEGLIAHWGASVESVEEALDCLRQEGISSLQVIFNLFRQHIAEEFFELAASKNVAIIARVPLASGLLSGKLNSSTVFSDNDHRNYNANGEKFNAGETFSGIDFQQGVSLAKEIGQILPDDRMAQWSLRWILDHPQVTTVIPGASKRYQVASNVEASDLPPLSPEIHSQLRGLYNEKILQSIRGKV